MHNIPTHWYTTALHVLLHHALCSRRCREERTQRRAKKKRAHKAKTAAKEAEARAKAVAAGGTADIVGRKSEAKVCCSLARLPCSTQHHTAPTDAHSLVS